jgi:hypothetical protein
MGRYEKGFNRCFELLHGNLIYRSCTIYTNIMDNKKFDLKDLVIFDYLLYWHLQRSKNKKWHQIKNNKVYCRINPIKISESIPILDLKRIMIWKRIQKYKEEGVIKILPNKTRIFIRFTNRFIKKYFGEEKFNQILEIEEKIIAKGKRV